jgi:conjugative relaxase-like TrwC/TraI family protein
MPVPDSSNCQGQELPVLILAKISRTSAGGYAEYLEGKAQASELGDYYLKDGERAEAPGRWAAGADLVGMNPDRPVTGEQLHALMDVRRPDNGGELRRAGGNGKAVAALDATFSAPKSVSAVWALAGRKLRAEIELAHETAIDRALGYASRQVAMLRRRVSGATVIHEKAAGVVATSWRHTTARAVTDRVPDPQLHSHVLLHAGVRRDGKLVAIDSRLWLVHQREVGAAYRTELARELARLGFDIRRGTGRGGRYFELKGVPQALLDRWSSRHHEVQAAIRLRLSDQERSLSSVIAGGAPGASEAAEQLAVLRRSGLSPAQERMIGTITRNGKAPVTVSDLDREWRHAAEGHGGSVERVEGLRREPHQVAPANAAEVCEGLTEFDATFPAREARAVALERSAGAPIQAALEQLRELRQHEEILVLADGTGTTREHRGRERAVVAIAERLATVKLEPLPGSAASYEIDRLNEELAGAGGSLSAEQRQAIRLGCGEHPLVVIEGQAGSGKSTTLTGIARAHEACGRQIIVTSTAALAAQRLATELTEHGVRCAAYSTAGLDGATMAGLVELTAHTTVIHDEAALASTREQLQLLRVVERSRGRLISVGDPRQNQPVGASGLWTHIEQTVTDTGAQVELTINQRARDPDDRRDQARFRDGEGESAIRSYAARDRVHIHHEKRRAEDQALEAAQADRIAGKNTIVIAQSSNEHLDQLNARAQAIRKQHGELGDESLDLPGRPYALFVGDHVQIRHTIQHPDLGQLRNGTNAGVTSIESNSGQLELQLGDGTHLQLSQMQIDQADLRLAYVQHPYPAQGQTTDTAHLIIADHVTRGGTYVGLTRARQQTHIYASQADDQEPNVDRLQELAERVNRIEPDLPSIRSPLTHETSLAREASSTSADRSPRSTAAGGAERAAELKPQLSRHSQQQRILQEPQGWAAEMRRVHVEAGSGQGIEEEVDTTFADQREIEPAPPTRVWPSHPEDELAAEHGSERDRSSGWEP